MTFLRALTLTFVILIGTHHGCGAFSVGKAWKPLSPTLLHVSASWIPPTVMLDDMEEENDGIEMSGNQLLTNAGTVLLEGLNPRKWSASTVDDRSSKHRGIFLHTSVTALNEEIPLGDLVSCSRLMACARVCRYWMGPAFGTSARDLPYDTQFLLTESDQEGGLYTVVLPLVDGGFRASLQANQQTGDLEVVCAAENGDPRAAGDMRAVYVAVGDDPFDLIQFAFTQVSQALGTFRTLNEKVLPPNVDEFGWCTWDAFYSKVDPAGILEGVKSLRNAGVPPRTLILDDGWQQVSPLPPSAINESTGSNPLSEIQGLLFGWLVNVVTIFYDTHVRTAPHGSFGNEIWRLLTRTVLKSHLWNYFDMETDFHRQLDDFAANDKFQQSDTTGDVYTLKGLVSTLKNDLGLSRVFCWHAIHGYWRGISGRLGEKMGIEVNNVFPKPSEHMLRVEPQLLWDTVALYGVGLVNNEVDVAKFYNHIHTPLVEAGIDGVKVDVQSGVSAVGVGDGDGPQLARIYTEGMEKSVSERFTSDDGGVNCINCMCHSTENLYRYQTTAIARASDDFFPDRPDSHTVHLYNVAYNSLFIGEICLPDWDMFQSKHESAALHAAARAVGGCPVYVSDKPGQHDTELLRKLVLPDGSVLRAQLPGRPTRKVLFVDVARDKVSALTVWNQNAYGGVVGAFNIQGVAWDFETHENVKLDDSPAPVLARVAPQDVESLRNTDGPFCVYNHRSSTLTLLENEKAFVEAKLNTREWEIFTIVPVQESQRVRWGPIGLADMLNSGGAILKADQLETTTTVDGMTATTAEVVSRGPGRFVAFCSPLPSRVLIGDMVVTELDFDYDRQTGQLTFVLPNETSEGVAHHLSIVWDQ